MKIGILKETLSGESRVAATPEQVKRWKKKGIELCVEKGAGEKAHFSDKAYSEAGAQILGPELVSQVDVLLHIHPISEATASQMKKGSILLCLLEPYKNASLLETLAKQGVEAFGLELVPRTSRAQSMDVLSSQANIAGYRAVLEGAIQYQRFFPLMMTSAGSAKPAKVAILGAGVAGLQAIATARRLGAQVESYDVRPEVKEQILSLGAKFIEIDTGESGSGSGGYAKELSEEAKAKQQAILTEKLKKFDIIVSTANIPGRKAPVLITEEAVKGMRPGSVIVDLAAANGGNCPLTVADQVTEKHGVILVGHTNYPSMVASDSSQFFGKNLENLLALMIQEENGKPVLKINLEDDILEGSLAVYQGSVKFQKR